MLNRKIFLSKSEFLPYTNWQNLVLFGSWKLFNAGSFESWILNSCIHDCYFCLFFRFQVKKKQFFRNFVTIMLFGAVGTLISFAIISFGTRHFLLLLQFFCLESLVYAWACNTTIKFWRQIVIFMKLCLLFS